MASYIEAATSRARPTVQSTAATRYKTFCTPLRMTRGLLALFSSDTTTPRVLRASGLAGLGRLFLYSLAGERFADECGHRFSKRSRRWALDTGGYAFLETLSQLAAGDLENVSVPRSCTKSRPWS